MTLLLLFGRLWQFSYVSAHSHFSDETYSLAKVCPQTKGRQRAERTRTVVLMLQKRLAIKCLPIQCGKFALMSPSGSRAVPSQVQGLSSLSPWVRRVEKQTRSGQPIFIQHNLPSFWTPSWHLSAEARDWWHPHDLKKDHELSKGSTPVDLVLRKWVNILSCFPQNIEEYVGHIFAGRQRPVGRQQNVLEWGLLTLVDGETNFITTLFVHPTF